MKKLVWIFITVLIVGAGCKKEETVADAREKFIGSWKGDQTMRIYENGQYVGESTDMWEFKIEEGDKIEDIIIDEVFEASVSGSRFIGDNQTVYMMIEDEPVEFEADILGEYTKNDRLILTIEMDAAESGYLGVTITFTGTFDPLN